jgi:inorganic triphosphatase YgiF
MAIEIELKLSAPDAAVLDRIAALDTIARYQVRPVGRVHIHDTAFDTPDHRLYRGHAVFRLRQKGGRRYLTFKAHAESDGNYFCRIEEESLTDAAIEDIAAGNLPNLPPVRLLRERFGDITLAPCLKTDNERRMFHLVRDVPHYELVLDDVTFAGPRGTARVFEVEVEALTDDHRDLDGIGEWLMERFDLKKTGPSKFALGMGLVGEV